MDLNTRAHSISPLYLSNFWFVVSSLGTEERNRGLLLPHLLRHGDRQVSRVTVSRVRCHE